MHRAVETETATSRFQASEWDLAPLHTRPVIVTPPSNEQELESFRGADLNTSEPVPHSDSVIDEELHNDLLERGMREHADIWRSLAKR